METPGMILKREREVRGLTLREIASVTRIPEGSLLALEENNFDVFPAEVFVRGFVRNYARELQISSEEVLHAYDSMKSQQMRHSVQLEPVMVSDQQRIAEEHALMFAPTSHEVDGFSTQSHEGAHRHFKFAYIIVILIAVVSVGLSIVFTGTGEAEEGDLLLPAAEDQGQVSPFLISNTSKVDE